MRILFSKSAIGKVAVVLLVFVIAVSSMIGIAVVLNQQPGSSLLLTSSPKPQQTTEAPEDTATLPRTSQSPIETVTPLPTLEPTPTPDSRPIQTIDLVTAVSTGLLTTNITGNDDDFQVYLYSNSDSRLNVKIPVGTVFTSQVAGAPEVITYSTHYMLLEPHLVAWDLVGNLSYITMNFDGGIFWNPYSVNTSPTTSPPSSSGWTWQAHYTDLVKLVSLPTLLSQTWRVQNFAVWTITNNPNKWGYRQIGYQYTNDFTGPSDSELQTIRSLFQAAGIQTDPYIALNS
jgi:hypothetical protein